MFAKNLVTAIDANRTVKDELQAAISNRGRRRRISVTDLVNPRQAFFRWTRPEIQPSLERLQVMLSGTGFHEIFGDLVAGEEYVEQFVEYEGIVGKIDIYQDVPTELKTTSFIPADIHADRASYIDQLGMYCAMTDRSEGRLVVYRREHHGRSPSLRAFDVRFIGLEHVRDEMLRRRDLLEHAIEAADPNGLPCCEWHERGCDYLEVCGCGEAPPIARVVPRGAAEINENEDLAFALRDKLRAPLAQPVTLFRLNDLVFPRKAAFERQAPAEEEEVSDSAIETRLIELERSGFKGALDQALRFGAPGAFSRTRVELRTLQGWVNRYREVPTILRSTRWSEMERRRVVDQFSHYFDRLAFECALVDEPRGRVVVYYERIPGDKFMVYDVAFGDLEAIRAEADRRLTLLENGAAPAELPACPPWMATYCKHAPACRCGA